jgi:hypothetical protein
MGAGAVGCGELMVLLRAVGEQLRANWSGAEDLDAGGAGSREAAKSELLETIAVSVTSASNPSGTLSNGDVVTVAGCSAISEGSCAGGVTTCELEEDVCAVVVDLGGRAVAAGLADSGAAAGLEDCGMAVDSAGEVAVVGWAARGAGACSVMRAGCGT